MAQQMVECIANFSEGRRTEQIDAIRQAFAAVPGVHVLDVQSDADHNRSVITCVGAPDAVAEAAFRATAKAAELIDMEQHRGVHPRIGATDVVPFVPIRGVTMAECVALARRVGQRIGEELGIPVYLYEEAATRPERKNLANIRRGEYERLKLEIAMDPARAPDFGPAKLGRAGATAVGARPPLIAYNVYLNSADVEIAKKIARAIRFIGGGLRYVKAIGLLVDGRAQVSLNLVNYRGTPLQRVLEMIRAEAARYGAAPVESEVIGLIPEDALLDAAEHYLQLNRFRRDQILERRLLALTANLDEADMPGVSAAGAAVSAGPAAGDGAAAALATALAASLAQLLAQRAPDSGRDAAGAEGLPASFDKLEALGAELSRLALVERRAAAALAAATQALQENGPQQTQPKAAFQAAMSRASQVSLAVAERAVAVLEALRPLAEQGGRYVAAEVRVAALLAQAATLDASGRLAAQLHQLADENQRAQLSTRIAAALAQARERLAALSEDT